MNYEYRPLYRQRRFAFDLNFYSQFILSRKNGLNESMNYDRTGVEQGRSNFHGLSRYMKAADFNLPPASMLKLQRNNNSRRRICRHALFEVTSLYSFCTFMISLVYLSDLRHSGILILTDY